MSLEGTKARLLAATETADGLLAQLNNLYLQETRSEEKFLEEALKQLHNSGVIDLIELVKGVDKNSSEYNFFTILHAFENTLPSLEASVEDVLHCLVHLTKLAGRDLAIGGVYVAYKNFCSREVNRPRDSVRIILDQGELSAYAPFLSCSILAYHSDSIAEAIQTTESLIAHNKEIVRSQAYFTLGRFELDETHASAIWELLSSNACRESDSSCCASILRATLYFGKTFPSYWLQIEDLLHTFIKTVSPELQYEISNIIAFQEVNIPESVLHLLVSQLTNVSPEHKGIIDNIDHLLVRLVERGSSSLAIELLESILGVGVDFPSLDYFSSELMSKHGELLSHITTKWFITGEPSLCHGVLDLLHDVTGKDIELKAEVALLDDEVKQVFVSHKAVGWLFTRPIAAASFILSICEIASTTIRKDLGQTLYDPLLLSYPGDLKRFFQSCIEQGRQSQICERLIGELLAYHTDIEKVSGLKELMAPNENVSKYWKDFNKGIQEAHENASESSLMSLFTTQKLLYGNSSIYYVHQGSGEQVRQEMEMQSFSHSTEMPRLNVLDPESLDYMLRVYRCERMKNEVDS